MNATSYTSYFDELSQILSRLKKIFDHSYYYRISRLSKLLFDVNFAKLYNVNYLLPIAGTKLTSVRGKFARK